jgi:hypothetical protein
MIRPEASHLEGLVITYFVPSISDAMEDSLVVSGSRMWLAVEDTPVTVRHEYLLHEIISEVLCLESQTCSAEAHTPPCTFSGLHIRRNFRQRKHEHIVPVGGLQRQLLKCLSMRLI